MAQRKSAGEFHRECGGAVFGYALREGQVMPETYGELAAFMVDRLKVSSSDDPAAALSEWLMSGGKLDTSCSPETDTAHAEAVVLIGDLQDPDGYVASLPDEIPGMLPLPPSDLVREMIASESV